MKCCPVCLKHHKRKSAFCSAKCDNKVTKVKALTVTDVRTDIDMELKLLGMVFELIDSGMDPFTADKKIRG